MTEAKLEHVNVTVRDAEATAAKLCALFGWNIRWQGPSIHDGYSVHVGGETSYIALYTPSSTPNGGTERYFSENALNHIGVIVDDLGAAEAKIKATGYQPYSHSDYEPGRRFYFKDENGVEYEVLTYA